MLKTVARMCQEELEDLYSIHGVVADRTNILFDGFINFRTVCKHTCILDSSLTS